MIIPVLASHDTAFITTYFNLLDQGAAPFIMSPRLPENQRQILLRTLEGKKALPSSTLLLTSGSTAAPKIACIPLPCFTASAETVNQALQVEPHHRWGLSLPFFHVGGLSLLFRNRQTKTSSLHDTHLSLVPTQLYRGLTHGFPKEICCFFLGGSLLPPTLQTRAEEKGYNVRRSYGMTEMSSTIAVDGHVLPTAEVMISSEGEILVKGKTLFAGYYNPQTEEIELPLDPQGWFHTRDLGRWSQEGLLEVIGRKDNLFISGGENIQPEEIEMLIAALPGIAQAIVAPRPDSEFGFRPVAFIEDITNSYNLESLRAALSHQLPRFKLPIALYPLKSGDIKPQRHHLKALLTPQEEV